MAVFGTETRQAGKVIAKRVTAPKNGPRGAEKAPCNLTA